MKLAVLSGKGGAGKTFVAVNLAVTARQAVYIDCDVEEPNGRLFLKPEIEAVTPVSTLLPEFDTSRCNGCRACVNACRFHALVYLKERPMVFPEVCHACGACSLVCPTGAVREVPHPIGMLEQGHRGGVRVMTGILNPGEASGVPVIRAALAQAESDAPLTVIDCPPGSACPVLESAQAADRCLLVAEPTAFGLHNLDMVYRLVILLGKPCGVVINKETEPYAPLEAFCRDRNLPILGRIPYQAQLAQQTARGGIACETVPAASQLFSALLNRIAGWCV